jgi:hypothetical protein
MSATANIKLVGTSSLTEVDSSSDNALFVEGRPPALNGFGAYSITVSTGNVTATLAANAPLFSMRWTAPGALCLIHRVAINVGTVTSVTAAVRSNWVLRGLREFVVNDTGGTQVSVATTANDQKLRTSMPPSLFGINDIRVATTGTLTAGTRIRDANMLGYLCGNVPAASGVGAWLIGPGSGLVPLFDGTGVGDYPLLLTRYDGFAIESEVTGPATGTFTLVVRVEWLEVPLY